MVPRLRGAVSHDQVAALLSDLVAIPSVNPMHDQTTDPPFGEARVADYIEQYARSLGLEVTRQPVLPDRHNLLITLPGRTPNHGLLFECHMDTVPGWSGEPDPFDARVVDGRLYGRGACDVKGTLAAMLLALRLLVDRDLQPPRPVLLAATVDEEYQARGVRRLVEQGVAAESAVVGEPTGLTVVVAHMGCIRWRLAARGRSAHSSRTDLGVNAIDAMVDLLTGLRHASRSLLQERRHPLTGAPVLNICTIHGGVAANVIPEECIVEIDRRTIPGEDPLTVDAETRALVAQLAEKIDGVRFILDTPFIIDPPLDTAPDAPIVRAARHAAEAVLGRSSIGGVSFGTDAGTLTERGISTIVFGPGSIDEAHTRNESIALEEVARAAEILATLALADTTEGQPDPGRRP
ncbi:MAG: M20 family metallopeptidase [Chloroflexi bacterium]|nr:M20 family metallopeptidase [Chloroflexota bacterium]